jgi:dUTP pyrophosphatase
MKYTTIKIEVTDDRLKPSYATSGSAAVDLCARVEEGAEPMFVIMPGERTLVPTGIRLSMPEGIAAEVQPRSGLALKQGITVLNAPGLIDSDYRKEVGVIIYNASDEPFTINHGDRIAQLKFIEYVRACFDFDEVDDDTGRGGFGSTGK